MVKEERDIMLKTLLDPAIFKNFCDYNELVESYIKMGYCEEAAIAKAEEEFDWEYAKSLFY